ncbi:MAG: hypothetical protein IKY06_04630, partial [Clostridia bacterium]|nr:hypothetical protein [Clostridia bacterium]
MKWIGDPFHSIDCQLRLVNAADNKERIFLKSCGISERKIRRESFFTPGGQARLRKKAVLGAAEP